MPRSGVPLTTEKVQLLTAEQVAAQLGMKRDFVWRLARSGQLPAIRMSPRAVRFRASDVEEFIAKHEVGR